METSLTRIYDTPRARSFFEDKLAFTTGPVELERMIKSGDSINIVDVRAAEDFAKGHVPGAINLPTRTWDNGNGLSKDKTNIIYCYTQTCHLAARACSLFADKGYPVLEMEGGFEAWEANELAIEHEPINRVKRTGERLSHHRD
jgi:rhodanese-related sulfurtransferase